MSICRQQNNDDRSVFRSLRNGFNGFMRVALYTNLTSRNNVDVLAKLVEIDQADLVQVIFYNTMREARQSPLVTLREFGIRRILGKIARIGASKLRRILARTPLKAFIQADSTSEFCVFRGIPFSVVDNLNTPHAHQQLRDLNLDLLIVCNCKNILRGQTLNIPRLGSMNIHPSLLPHYRGPMPVFWILYHGDVKGGVTFQQMTPQIDDGPIIAQYEAPVDLCRSEDAICCQMFELAARHLNEVLTRIREGNVVPFQPSEPGSYFSFPTAQEQAELKNRTKSRSKFQSKS